MMVFPLTLTFIVIPPNLYLHSHDICFVNAFDLLILLIILKTLGFKSSSLFGINALLYKSLRILQIATHLSNLTVNG